MWPQVMNGLDDPRTGPGEAIEEGKGHFLAETAREHLRPVDMNNVRDNADDSNWILRHLDRHAVVYVWAHRLVSEGQQVLGCQPQVWVRVRAGRNLQKFPHRYSEAKVKRDDLWRDARQCGHLGEISARVADADRTQSSLDST